MFKDIKHYSTFDQGLIITSRVGRVMLGAGVVTWGAAVAAYHVSRILK